MIVTVECPTCGEHVDERCDRVGDRTTNNYAIHYESEHNASPLAFGLPYASTVAINGKPFSCS